jgi:3-phosphoshikimate 1-carboxyvinyltransferase
LCIHGGAPQGNATIQSYNDHRIAMAATIAGLHTIDSINITEAECVAKSYPRFFEDIQKLGGNIKFQ